jgi:hypothetical protein
MEQLIFPLKGNTAACFTVRGKYTAKEPETQKLDVPYLQDMEHLFFPERAILLPHALL